MFGSYVNPHSTQLLDLPKEFSGFKVVSTGPSRLSAIGPDSEGQWLFIKYFYGDAGYKQGLMEYRALQCVRTLMQCSTMCSVPEPYSIKKTAAGGGILQAEFINMRRGDLWFKWFSRIGPLKRRGLSNVARWISNFHSIEAQKTKKFGELTDYKDILECMNQKIDRYGQSFNAQNYVFQEFLEIIEDLKDREVYHGILHGDFTSSNIFIGWEETVGFDFTLSVIGPVYRDIAKFLMALVWPIRPVYGRYNFEVFLRDRDVFCSSYEKSGIILDRKLLDFYLVESMLEKMLSLESRSAKVGYRKRVGKSSERHIRLLFGTMCDVVTNASKA